MRETCSDQRSTLLSLTCCRWCSYFTSQATHTRLRHRRRVINVLRLGFVALNVVQRVRRAEVGPNTAEEDIRHHHLQRPTSPSRISVTLVENANEKSIRVDCPPDLGSTVPRVSFKIPFKISLSHYYSYYRVFIGGTLVHADATDLSFASSRAGVHEYSTQLIPLYWSELGRTNVRIFRDSKHHNAYRFYRSLRVCYRARYLANAFAF